MLGTPTQSLLHTLRQFPTLTSSHPSCQPPPPPLPMSSLFQLQPPPPSWSPALPSTPFPPSSPTTFHTTRSIREFAGQVSGRPLHGLINNAGLQTPRDGKTKDGLEVSGG